ncbi:MAG: hypothetical protein HY782_20080 [Chloroflexi bacterium]|nr:hypothetical protein [Chloroflexota bacterium]
MFRMKWLAMLALVVFLAASAYGFAASNTIDTSGAGEGAATISGYTISGIKYTVNRAAGDSTITAVSFDVTPKPGGVDANNVEARLKDSGVWYSCTGPTVNNWSCDTTGTTIKVKDADNLTVVAWQE